MHFNVGLYDASNVIQHSQFSLAHSIMPQWCRGMKVNNTVCLNIHYVLVKLQSLWFCRLNTKSAYKAILCWLKNALCFHHYVCWLNCWIPITNLDFLHGIIYSCSSLCCLFLLSSKFFCFNLLLVSSLFCPNLYYVWTR